MKQPASSLTGTVWAGATVDSKGTTADAKKDRLVLRFLDGGILDYTTPTGTFRNGGWTQDGDLVIFYMNNGYAIYDGRIAADAMEGSAKNTVGLRWTWSAKKQ